MSFASYTGSVTIGITDSPAGAAPTSSLSFGTPSNSTNIPIKTAYTLGTNTAGEINSVSTGILTIAQGGSATLDLTSLTDMLGQTAVALARLKKYIFWLLSPQDDSTAGTDCTQVTIGASSSNPNNLNMGGTSPTQILKGGGSTDFGDKVAYVSRTASGIAVSGTACNVLVTNNDPTTGSTHNAALFYNLGGATA